MSREKIQAIIDELSEKLDETKQVIETIKTKIERLKTSGKVNIEVEENLLAELEEMIKNKSSLIALLEAAKDSNAPLQRDEFQALFSAIENNLEKIYLITMQEKDIDEEQKKKHLNDKEGMKAYLEDIKKKCESLLTPYKMPTSPPPPIPQGVAAPTLPNVEQGIDAGGVSTGTVTSQESTGATRGRGFVEANLATKVFRMEVDERAAATEATTRGEGAAAVPESQGAAASTRPAPPMPAPHSVPQGAAAKRPVPPHVEQGNATGAANRVGPAVSLPGGKGAISSFDTGVPVYTAPALSQGAAGARPAPPGNGKVPPMPAPAPKKSQTTRGARPAVSLPGGSGAISSFGEGISVPTVPTLSQGGAAGARPAIQHPEGGAISSFGAGVSSSGHQGGLAIGPNNNTILTNKGGNAMSKYHKLEWYLRPVKFLFGAASEADLVAGHLVEKHASFNSGRMILGFSSALIFGGIALVTNVYPAGIATSAFLTYLTPALPLLAPLSLGLAITGAVVGIGASIAWLFKETKDYSSSVETVKTRIDTISADDDIARIQRKYERVFDSNYTEPNVVINKMDKKLDKIAAQR